MIVRIWKATASVARADAYPAHFSAAVSPNLRKLAGFAGGRLLRRRTGDHVEFMVVTQWESWQAITAFAGADPDVAVVDSQARAMLVQHDSCVQHFEVVQETSV